MPFILTSLRVVHIIAGAFWVGSALLLALVILPGLRKAGPGSERALPMAQILQAMGLSSMLTTLAGLLLYGWVSRFAWGWIVSPLGLGFTGPTAQKLTALGRQLQAAGGPAKPEQMAELGTSSRWSTVLASAALVLMAVARYL